MSQRTFSLVTLGMLCCLPLLGCDGGLPSEVTDLIGDLVNGNGSGGGGGTGGQGPSATLEVYATNTGGASGLAIRPTSDGALFAVNSGGLYGPIMEGDDLDALTPIGATNLDDDTLFDLQEASLVLAISNAGDFWIASRCCVTMAVVPADGGDAEPFLGLFDVSEIKPDSLALVPDGFSGNEIMAGQILAGQTTTFSRLAAINVAIDDSTLDITNPSDLNRQSHHLTFGLDGNLYSSRETPALTQAGVQQIATDGTPTDLDWSFGVAADSFVVLANGDMVMVGNLQESGGESTGGILFYSAEDDRVTVALEITSADRSEDDEMVITSDGSTIYLALPNRNQIVRVTVN